MTLSPVSDGFAQTCEYVQDSQDQRQQRLMRVDGELYFVFPEQKARQLLKDVKKLDSYQVELQLKDQKIDLLQRRIELYQDESDMWKGHYQSEHKLVKTFLDKESSRTPLFEKGWVQFGLGFIVASGLYVGWQASYQKF